MTCDGMKLEAVSTRSLPERCMSYLVSGIADGDYALEVPLSKDVLLQGDQDRRDLVVQNILELQVGSNVVVFRPLEHLGLVFIGVCRDVFAISPLR